MFRIIIIERVKKITKFDLTFTTVFTTFWVDIPYTLRNFSKFRQI